MEDEASQDSVHCCLYTKQYEENHETRKSQGIKVKDNTLGTKEAQRQAVRSQRSRDEKEVVNSVNECVIDWDTTAYVGEHQVNT